MRKYFEALTEASEFGQNSYGWPTFKSEAWLQTFEKTSDSTTVYTTSLPFSIRPLYLVEQINGDMRLPVNFRDYAYLLPENKLILKEMSNFYGKQVGFEFKSASFTSYFLDISKWASQ